MKTVSAPLKLTKNKLKLKKGKTSTLLRSWVWIFVIFYINVFPSSPNSITLLSHLKQETNSSNDQNKIRTQRWTIERTIELTSPQIAPNKTNSINAASKRQPQTQALTEPRLRLDRPHCPPAFTNNESCLELTCGFIRSQIGCKAHASHKLPPISLQNQAMASWACFPVPKWHAEAFTKKSHTERKHPIEGDDDFVFF